MMDERELVEKTDEHTHMVPHGDRSDVPIEPYLTDQWYVNAKVLAAAGDRQRARRADRHRPEELGEDLFRLDGEHPALVHLAPALVGPPHPGVVRPEAERRRLRLRRARDVRRRIGGGGAGGRRKALPPRRGGDAVEPGSGGLLGGGIQERSAAPRDTPLARRGRARHLVLLGALAVLDARLAGRDAGAQALLPDERARHRLRHHLLLGGADDDDGAPLHEEGAVPHHLHPRHRARREGRQDVEVEGERGRSPRTDRRVRRRRAALHDGVAGDAARRREAVARAHRRLSQLRHQDLERGALLRDQRMPPRSGFRSGERRRKRSTAGS